MPVKQISALRPKADACAALAEVRQAPTAGIAAGATILAAGYL
jgi:hypothetical protein